MITLTRMGGKDVLINEDWLVAVEENPDTTLIFASGMKLIVKESRQELLAKVKAWQASRPKTAHKPRRMVRN
jgi:uncharacterized protein YlzI (FlbEa/FlbD family)